MSHGVNDMGNLFTIVSSVSRLCLSYRGKIKYEINSKAAFYASAFIHKRGGHLTDVDLL